MSDEALKKLNEIDTKLNETREDLKGIKKFMTEHDKVSNKDYCAEEGITSQTLYNWFSDGCPRLDNRNVSRSAVKEWKAERSTRKPKH
jgi:hypothetical protein